MKAIVAGTTYPNRDGTDRGNLIRRYCYEGAKVFLIREPDNEHDRNAVAVYLGTTSYWKRRVQIGYIKSPAAKRLAPKMDGGANISAVVTSFFAPSPELWPRVTIEIKTA